MPLTRGMSFRKIRTPYNETPINSKGYSND
nr:MAG TPA: hypothetical protein [Caudoviricetes sp.]